MTDDPGVMGNLPRSRPGRRSEKRAAEVKPKKATTTRAKGSAGGAKAGGAKASASGARAGGAKTSASRAKASGSRARAAGAKASASQPRAAGAKASTSRARTEAPPTAVREERTEAPRGQDPITAALKLGMAVGDAGVKTLAKIVQRLPRP